MLVIPIVLAGALVLLWAGRTVGRNTSWLGSAWVGRNLRYQPIALATAVLAVLATRSLVPGHADFLAVGDWGAPASGLAWLGVAPGDPWTTVGWTFLVIMTLVTGVVVWLQVARGAGISLSGLVRALPLALAFSVVNAVGEELLFRLTVAEALAPVVATGVVAGVSATLFGIPHWFGTPGRVPGMLLAAFMGWLLAFAVVQTQGMGWAIAIHVVQDVVIITLLIARDWSRP